MAENVILYSTLCDENENSKNSENQDMFDENEDEEAFEASQGENLVHDYGESESNQSRIGDTEETVESDKNGASGVKVDNVSNPEVDVESDKNGSRDENVANVSNPEVDVTEPVPNGPGTDTTGHIVVDADNLEVAGTSKDGKPLSNDDDESNTAEEAAPKRVAHSKKNRNIKSAITTIKNKIENIQTKNGGSPNYLLILEDNFSDVSATGPKNKTNRKLIVTEDGNLRE